MEHALIGSCLACGGTAYGQAYCDRCDSEDKPDEIEKLKAKGYVIRGQVGKLLFVTTPLGTKTVKKLEG